jgi:hypothetical protein
MKQESASFTAADVPRFFEEIFLVDVRNTMERLRAAGQRLDQLSSSIADERGQGPDWNAKEILAHIAILSRAYGVFAYMVGNGRLAELELGPVISQRDVVGEEMAQRPVQEIMAEIRRQHERTLTFLESATAEQLRRTCKTENGEITAEHLVRVPLVAHLEQHVGQLEEALAKSGMTAR